jgi:GT2 family glycosyltransferase
MIRTDWAETRKTDSSRSLAARVSVIIPCYNQANYLGEAIRSVLDQAYTNFQIIVVDDGSTDNTSEVVAGYSDVRCIRQANQGLAAARNAGLHGSQGNYVVFLDADDRLLPHALDTGLSCLKANPVSAFVSGHFRFIKDDGTLLREFPQKQIEDDHYLALLQRNYIGMHATVMYRRDVLESVGGFDTSLRACEDYDLYLRIARISLICCHDKTIAEYRIHDANMSRNAALMLKTSMAVLRSQWKYAKADRKYKKACESGMRLFRSDYGEKLFVQIGHMLKSGEVLHAVSGTMKLLRYAPRWLVGRSFKTVRYLAYASMKAVLPVSVRRLLLELGGCSYDPPVGHVHFGDLRRVTPLSRKFGYDRGLPIDRYYIENFLSRFADDIGGRVLEIGDDSYTRRFGGDRVVIRDVFHVQEGNPLATFVGDLTNAPQIPSDIFDCFILTQTLHLIYDVRAALQTIYRILKPGGIVLATFPGISQISGDQWGGQWYWSFTKQSAQKLLGEVFPADHIMVETHGNVLAAGAFLYGLATRELLQEELDYHDPDYEVIIAVRAVKPGGTI